MNNLMKALQSAKKKPEKPQGTKLGDLIKQMGGKRGK